MENNSPTGFFSVCLSLAVLGRRRRSIGVSLSVALPGEKNK